MSIILHISCGNIDFSKRGTAPLKGGLDIWKCTLQSFKGQVQLFKEYFQTYFVWILSLQKHTALPQRKIAPYSEGYVCFEYCIWWQVWGCCNYVGVI